MSIKIFSFLIFVGLFISSPSYSQVPVTDSLIKLTVNHKKDTALVSLFTEISKALWKKGDIETSAKWADSVKVLSEKIDYPPGIGNYYHLLGNIAMESNEYDEAKKNFNIAINLRKKINDKIALSTSYFALAKLEINFNHYDSSEFFSNKSIEYAKEGKDSVALVKAINILAGSYFRTGRYEKAMETWLLELKIAEALNDSLSIAIVTGNIGTVYTEMKNNPEAIKFLKKSLAQRFHNKQIKEAASTYLNLGRCYKRLQLVDSAIYFYRLGLEISVQYKIHTVTAILYDNIAATLTEKGLFDSAMYYNHSSKIENEIIKDTLGIARNYLYEGDILAFMGAAYKNRRKEYWTKAEKNYFESLRLSRLISNRDWVLENYMKLADLYGEWKKYEDAYTYLEKYRILNDSLRNSTFTAQIAEMETKYETGKKELEISRLGNEKLLDAEKIARQRTLNYSLAIIAGLIIISGFLIFRNIKKKRESERQIAVLEKQNAIESMRSKIASDVHDDMGANLTRIGLYTQQLLQEKNTSGKDRLLLEKISLQSKDVITGMKEIIWASNPANDNLKSMLNFMRQYIDRFFDGLDIRTTVNFPHNTGSVILHPEVRRNLFLILKESLNNAVKYSGTDKMDIDFQSDDNEFKFSIKDFGKGLDDKSKDEFHNGMHNMRKRAEQIQSAFNLVSAPGQGVHILISGKLY